MECNFLYFCYIVPSFTIAEVDVANRIRNSLSDDPSDFNVDT